MMISRQELLNEFEIFNYGTSGLTSLLSNSNAPEEVIVALSNLEGRPLTRPQFNQLLTLSHEASISDGFFQYYWLSVPKNHPYKVSKIPRFSEEYCLLNAKTISSKNQLYWGLYRFFVDALLYYGNVLTAFQELRSWSYADLENYFTNKQWNTMDMKARGRPLDLTRIEKSDRYLISEMACKSLEAGNFADSELARTLIDIYREHKKDSITVAQLLEGESCLNVSIESLADLQRTLETVSDTAFKLYEQHIERQVTAGQLLGGARRRGAIEEQQQRLYLTADDFLNDPIADENDLLDKVERVHQSYEKARNIALKNTEIYLSSVGDLDVYVATSMRERNDFLKMADFCEKVFSAPMLQDYHLRYFDPTLSAAMHHEDKGLIECLMVRRAKVLVLHAGSRDSYGKDAEAAMALSLGKPVIIHADAEYRSRFFKDVHPLSRLIDFQTGVAIGALVATSEEEVVTLLKCIFENDLEFKLEQSHPKYLVLKEKITDSVVRLQTNSDLIRETFWNHYHSDVR